MNEWSDCEMSFGSFIALHLTFTLMEHRRLEAEISAASSKDDQCSFLFSVAHMVQTEKVLAWVLFGF